MADAGFRLSVEGEREFRKAISDINAILKLNQSELKRSVAEYNASEKDMDALTKRHKELEAAITTQIGAISEMSGEYSRLRNEYGENDKGVIKMKGSLDEAAASLATMQEQLSDTEKEMKKLTDATDPLVIAMEEAKKSEEKLQEAWNEYQNILKETEKDIDAQIKALKAESDASTNTATKKRLLTDAINEQKDKLKLLNEELGSATERYGAQSREVAEYRTQIANATVELSQMEEQLKDNKKAIEEAEEEAGDLEDVFSQISDVAGVNIPNGLTTIVGGLDSVTAAGGLAATAVAGILKAVSEAAEKAQDFAVEIGKMANEYNLTTTQVQELQHVSSMLNVEYEGVVDTLKDLTEKMYDASTGNEDLSKEFNDLGVSIYDSNGELRESFDVLVDLIDAYGDMENKTERAARMQKILGESSRTLNTLIYAGGDAIKQYRTQAHEWGIVMEDDVIDKLEVAEQKVRELDAAWDAMIRNWAADTKLNFKSLISGDFAGFWEGTSASDAATAAGKKWFELLLQKITGNYATGTYNHPGGYALVGERGPEIVDLPAGSRVYPNGEGPAMGTVNYYNITIPASDIREFNDIVRIAQSKRIVDRMK